MIIPIDYSSDIYFSFPSIPASLKDKTGGYLTYDENNIQASADANFNLDLRFHPSAHDVNLFYKLNIDDIYRYLINNHLYDPSNNFKINEYILEINYKLSNCYEESCKKKTVYLQPNTEQTNFLEQSPYFIPNNGSNSGNCISQITTTTEAASNFGDYGEVIIKFESDSELPPDFNTSELNIYFTYCLVSPCIAKFNYKISNSNLQKAIYFKLNEGSPLTTEALFYSYEDIIISEPFITVRYINGSTQEIQHMINLTYKGGYWTTYNSSGNISFIGSVNKYLLSVNEINNHSLLRKGMIILSKEPDIYSESSSEDEKCKCISDIIVPETEIIDFGDCTYGNKGTYVINKRQKRRCEERLEAVGCDVSMFQEEVLYGNYSIQGITLSFNYSIPTVLPFKKEFIEFFSVNTLPDPLEFKPQVIDLKDNMGTMKLYCNQLFCINSDISTNYAKLSYEIQEQDLIKKSVSNIQTVRLCFTVKVKKHIPDQEPLLKCQDDISETNEVLTNMYDEIKAELPLSYNNGLYATYNNGSDIVDFIDNPDGQYLIAMNTLCLKVMYI
jgi:hypothetical protein